MTKTCLMCQQIKEEERFRLIGGGQTLSSVNVDGTARRAGWCMDCEEEYRKRSQDAQRARYGSQRRAA